MSGQITYRCDVCSRSASRRILVQQLSDVSDRHAQMAPLPVVDVCDKHAPLVQVDPQRSTWAAAETETAA